MNPSRGSDRGGPPAGGHGRRERDAGAERGEPLAHALMEREGLAGTFELQAWFLRRLKGMLTERNRVLVGWNEGDQLKLSVFPSASRLEQHVHQPSRLSQGHKAIK